MAQQSPLGTPAWKTKIVLVQEDRLGTTALANSNYLQFAMRANKKYAIRILVHYVANATPDIKWGLTGPASPTNVGCYHQTQGTSLSFASQFNASYPTNITHVTAGFSQGLIQITLRVDNGANAGTFAFQFAQNTSDGSNNTSVLVGSTIEWIEI